MKHGAPMRCHRCNARHALPRPLREYKRDPRCRYCRRPLRLDRYRAFVEHKRWKDFCMCCAAYTFPHRRGSKWCIHNPNLPRDDVPHWLSRAPTTEEIPF